MIGILKRFIYCKNSQNWICPNCGCEREYLGEGNKKCPVCGKWMQLDE